MKKIKTEKTKINKEQSIMIGSFILILLCSSMIFYELYNRNKADKLNESLLIEFFEKQEEIKEKEEIIEPVIEEKTKEQVSSEYLGVLKIEKINLIRGFYSKDSKNNNVNQNIKLLKESNMPEEENGNIILAGHSGNSYVSFFKRLSDLSNGDEAKIYYREKTYIYSLVNNYEVEKTGSIHITKDNSKNTLNLITCKHNTNKQLVFIFELKNIE